MIKKMYKLGVLFLGAAMLFAACTKKPDVEHTTTEKMAGEWFMQLVEGGQVVVDYHTVLTYNTANPSSGQVWFDDPEIWEFKAKLDVDIQNLAFKPMNAATDVVHAGVTMKVYEGKVMPRAAKSKSGNSVDSIYLKVEFSDDPGTIYEYKGHQRTGFFEDEY
jgi:Lipid-binding putative hydrolase